MEDFSNRMRERMPAHRVWTTPSTAPTLSRPASDAMWDEMRARLRSFDASRKAAARGTTVGAAWEAFTDAAARHSMAALLLAAVLLVIALIGMLR